MRYLNLIRRVQNAKQCCSLTNCGSSSNPATIAGAGYTGSVIYEYFKKGAEPTNTQTVDTLEAPSNFTVSYSEDSDTVNLSWNAVNPGISDSSYGTFGYNVYFNDTLLGFTDTNKLYNY